MRITARLLPLALVCSFGLTVCSVHAASGWLNWRGPDHNGISPAKQKLVTDLTLGGPTHRWTFKAHGAGRCSGHGPASGCSFSRT